MVAQCIYITNPPASGAVTSAQVDGNCLSRREEVACTLPFSSNQLYQDKDRIQEQDDQIQEQHEDQDQDQDDQIQEQDDQIQEQQDDQIQEQQDDQIQEQQDDRDQDQDDQIQEQVDDQDQDPDEQIQQVQDQEQGDQIQEQHEDQDELARNDDADDGVVVSKSDIQQKTADDCINYDSDDDDDGCEGELIIVEDDNAISIPMASSGSSSDNGGAPLVQEHQQNVCSGTHHRNGSRNEVQQKMEEGKQWLTKTVMFVNTVLSVMPLSSIEEAYQAHCKETKKDPLTTPVLARLIRGLFPGAVKCRLGSRGNQRIHYRNLQLKSFKVQAQSSLVMSESVKESSHHCETSFSIDASVKDSISLTDEESTNAFGQEIEQRECCVERKENSKELIEGGETQHGTVPEESAKRQEGKIGATETPKPKNPKAQITREDNQEGCQPAAQRLTEVLKWIFSQGRKDVLLREFAHSASCQVLTCTPLCQMFRRIRRHVVAARHSCSVLCIYSMLLRLHVSSCNNSDCGLPACPALRATRPAKRSLEQQGNLPKRSAMQRPCGVLRPSTLSLAPRSPATSLPGSPVNSPPASPDHYPLAREFNWPAQAGQVQYVIVPVMMPFSDNRGA